MDVVEEKEVDPQVKQLRATLVAANEQFEVSQPIPRYVDIECIFELELFQEMMTPSTASGNWSGWSLFLKKTKCCIAR